MQAASGRVPDAGNAAAITHHLGNRAAARLQAGTKVPPYIAAVAHHLGNRAVARLLASAEASRDAAGGELDPGVAARIDASRRSGAPLPDDVRVPMQQELGADLESVRVHTDDTAATLARSVDAQAFTTGHDMFFSAGSYDPRSPSGRELIAHEAVHVAQQAFGGLRLSERVSDPSEPTEVEARRLAPGLARSVDAAPPDVYAFDGPNLVQRRHPVATLPRVGGDAGVAALLQRDSTGAAVAPPTPSSLRMRSVPTVEDLLDGLRQVLQREGKGSVWSLLAGVEFKLTPPRLLPRAQGGAESAPPTQITFGPLSSDATLKALTHVPEKPGWLDEALRPREERESVADLLIVYENDGTGIFPNFGSGSDQGRTAALYLGVDFNKQGTGLTRVGVTAMEMTTPRGSPPPPGSSIYETSAGPYSGVVAIDLGYTVERSGTKKVDFMLTAGLDSREWGKLVQDFIHEKISDSPVFPWPSGTKPLIEGGVRINKTINDLTREDFAGLSYTGRLELDASVLTGTRRTEATGGARFVIQTAKVYTPAGAISIEFSPLGAFARGFVRYNDGREGVLGGVEGGVNASLMINIGRIGVGLRGEGLVSSDPAFQTDVAAGGHPTALKGSPFVGDDYGLPAGAHGTGQLLLKFGF